MEMLILEKYTGFDWDEGNQGKNWAKHGISQGECEQIFFNVPLLLHIDIKHSAHEDRWFVLGKANINKKLFLAFTLRKNLIRVISARKMNKKEQKVYEKAKKNT